MKCLEVKIFSRNCCQKPIPSLLPQFVIFFTLMASNSWNAKEMNFLFALFRRAVRTIRTTDDYTNYHSVVVHTNGGFR